MANNALSPLWLAHLLACANQPPRRDRVPLYVGPAMVGSVEPDFLDQFVSSATRPCQLELRQETHRGGVCWRLPGEPTDAMALLANALRDSGLAGVWRNEQLGVTDHRGKRVGSIERAAVRPLGITTHAVHLLGKSPDGRVWVQQRALTKANDPGLWDTLVGGMVASVDTTETALKRETWEEAGLHLRELDAVAHQGRINVSRPSPEGRGAGYLLERVDWFTATVPADQNPVNQDGEVAQFALLSPIELVLWLEQDLFTVEAALVLVASLGLN
jgi:8-oxo-dGTP pyrophosphatase MutT (NUDIX family)